MGSGLRVQDKGLLVEGVTFQVKGRVGFQGFSHRSQVPAWQGYL